MLGNQAKELNFLSCQTRQSFSSHAQSPLCHLAKSERVFCSVLLKSGILLVFYLPQSSDWCDECCRDDCPSACFSHLCGGLKLSHNGHFFHIFAYLQASLAQILSLVGLAALERVTVVVPSIFHYIPMMEPTGLLQTFSAISNFKWSLSPSLALCLNTMLSKRSTENSLDLTAWFWQVWAFIYYVQLTECGPHGLNFSSTGIAMKMEGNQDWLSSIWSIIAMSLIDRKSVV